MKYPLIHVVLLLILPFGLSAQFVDLTSTNGRSISVTIESYSSAKKAVAVRINGEGRAIPIPMDRLDEDSQKAVLEWSEFNAISKFLTIRSERVTSGRGKRVFNIELVNQSKISIEDIRIEYFIPIKENYTERQVDDGSSSGNRTIKYKRVSKGRVISGSLDVEEIKAQGIELVVTEAISIDAKQSLAQGNGKDPKEITNKHSIKGLLLKLYIGDRLLREHESQNGVKQLIVKYNRD